VTALVPTATLATAIPEGVVVVVVNNNVFFIYTDLEITKIVTRIELRNVKVELQSLDILERFEDV